MPVIRTICVLFALYHCSFTFKYEDWVLLSSGLKSTKARQSVPTKTPWTFLFFLKQFYLQRLHWQSLGIIQSLFIIQTVIKITQWPKDSNDKQETLLLISSITDILRLKREPWRVGKSPCTWASKSVPNFTNDFSPEAAFAPELQH